MRTIQIRNVPESVHKRLRVRAARAGQSLSEMLRAEMTRIRLVADTDEMRERLRSRKSITLAGSAADAVRKERDS